MKPSRYNHFFTLDNGATLAFNSSSGALAEIEKENLTRIQQLLEHPEEVKSAQDKEFLSNLIEGGYLVPDMLDELSDLRTQTSSRRKAGSTYTLTVAPTLACNFACDYCFENQSKVRMEEKAQQALLDFSDHHLSQVNGMRVCWFGGEPTMCVAVIERLQTGLLELAQKHMVEVVPSSMVTNGYLLDGDMARRLKAVGIANAQITLDGPEKVHDQRRKLHSGKGTFRRIVDNLTESIDIMQIGIRINVDKRNIESAFEVMEELDRLGILPKVKIYFAKVKSAGAVCADIRDQCFGEEEFADNVVELYRRLMDIGISQVDYPKVFGGVFCGAVSERAFVISPTGHVFKCWEELALDPEKSVGDIFSPDQADYQKKNLEKLRSWDPFKSDECRECNILPICMGGCPVHSLNKKDSDQGVCSLWKFNLSEMMNLRYQCELMKDTGV